MRFARYAAAIVLVLFAAKLSFAEPIGQDNNAVQLIATPILDNILQSMKEGDYVKYTKDCDAALKDAMPKEAFDKAVIKLKESLGDLASKEYVGFLVKGNMTVVLWKAKYAQADDDILIKIVITKRDGKHLVTGLWFE